MHENDISMQDNCPWHDFLAPKIAMDSWAVHNFMHRIFTHEIYG